MKLRVLEPLWKDGARDGGQYTLVLGDQGKNSEQGQHTLFLVRQTWCGSIFTLGNAIRRANVGRKMWGRKIPRPIFLPYIFLPNLERP
ncbi:MAG: hypothetical protein AAF958_12860, partial [Planctomycetota bacterium]